MKSVCISCLVYTLKDSEVKDNMYLDIFYIWLGKLIQSGGLTSSDILQVTIDSRTCKYLETNDNILSILLEKLPCSFTIVEIPPPANSLEGMMNKYALTEYTQDVYIYCDIDILISSPIHTFLAELNDNTIYFCKESSLSHRNYSEGFTESIDKLNNLPGFSAGKFAIVGRELRDYFFKSIHDLCDYSTNFYTVEQPFFNKAVYMIPRDKISVDINLLTEYVSFNGNNYKKGKTIFNDMAGDVADGRAHATKIMNAIALFLAEFY
jgi:hypothetical protein